MALTRTGKPCPKGHDGTRYASNGACVECTKARRAAGTLNRLKERRYKRAYRAAKAAAPVPTMFADLLD